LENKDMTERLQKILSARGVTSRRAAEQMIQEGRITVNGQVAILGQTADPDVDEILVDGKPIPAGDQPVYIMLNKPRGFVTTRSDEKGRRSAAELVADCGVRVYPVGRLDLSSEGLLLFTNDGVFADAMMHPKHQIDKTYFVWVTGYTPEGFEKLQQPIELDGYLIKPPRVRQWTVNGEHARLEITIHEGRNRQVRRMCDAAGMHVTRLRRIREGKLKLGDLPVGKWRYLTEEEVLLLKGQKENDTV
jgi:23S rRNA pseudouridine2605 synthase